MLQKTQSLTQNYCFVGWMCKTYFGTSHWRLITAYIFRNEYGNLLGFYSSNGFVPTMVIVDRDKVRLDSVVIIDWCVNVEFL